MSGRVPTGVRRMPLGTVSGNTNDDSRDSRDTLQGLGPKMRASRDSIAAERDENDAPTGPNASSRQDTMCAADMSPSGAQAVSESSGGLAPRARRAMDARRTRTVTFQTTQRPQHIAITVASRSASKTRPSPRMLQRSSSGSPIHTSVVIRDPTRVLSTQKPRFALSPLNALLPELGDIAAMTKDNLFEKPVSGEQGDEDTNAENIATSVNDNQTQPAMTPIATKTQTKTPGSTSRSGNKKGQRRPILATPGNARSADNTLIGGNTGRNRVRAMMMTPITPSNKAESSSHQSGASSKRRVGTHISRNASATPADTPTSGMSGSRVSYSIDTPSIMRQSMTTLDEDGDDEDILNEPVSTRKSDIRTQMVRVFDNLISSSMRQRGGSDQQDSKEHGTTNPDVMESMSFDTIDIGRKRERSATSQPDEQGNTIQSPRKGNVLYERNNDSQSDIFEQIPKSTDRISKTDLVRPEDIISFLQNKFQGIDWNDENLDENNQQRSWKSLVDVIFSRSQKMTEEIRALREENTIYEALCDELSDRDNKLLELQKGVSEMIAENEMTKTSMVQKIEEQSSIIQRLEQQLANANTANN